MIRCERDYKNALALRRLKALAGSTRWPCTRWEFELDFSSLCNSASERPHRLLVSLLHHGHDQHPGPQTGSFPYPLYDIDGPGEPRSSKPSIKDDLRERKEEHTSNRAPQQRWRLRVRPWQQRWQTSHSSHIWTFSWHGRQSRASQASFCCSHSFGLRRARSRGSRLGRRVFRSSVSLSSLDAGSKF